MTNLLAMLGVPGVPADVPDGAIKADPSLENSIEFASVLAEMAAATVTPVAVEFGTNSDPAATAACGETMPAADMPAGDLPTVRARRGALPRPAVPGIGSAMADVDPADVVATKTGVIADGKPMTSRPADLFDGSAEHDPLRTRLPIVGCRVVVDTQLGTTAVRAESAHVASRQHNSTEAGNEPSGEYKLTWRAAASAPDSTDGRPLSPELSVAAQGEMKAPSISTAADQVVQQATGPVAQESYSPTGAAPVGVAEPSAVAAAPESVAPLGADALSSTPDTVAVAPHAGVGRPLTMSSATATVPDMQAPSSSDMTRVQDQVLKQVLAREIAANDDDTLTLHLKPEHLGKVEVRLIGRGQRLEVVFTAESAAAEQSLRNGARELAQALGVRDGGRWQTVEIRVADNTGQGGERRDSDADDADDADEHDRRDQQDPNQKERRRQRRDRS